MVEHGGGRAATPPRWPSYIYISGSFLALQFMLNCRAASIRRESAIIRAPVEQTLTQAQHLIHRVISVTNVSCKVIAAVGQAEIQLPHFVQNVSCVTGAMPVNSRSAL